MRFNPDKCHLLANENDDKFSRQKLPVKKIS